MARMSVEEQPILAESSNEQPQAPRAASRWRVAAVAAAAAGVLALTWARSGRPERPSRGFLDEVMSKAESEDAESCTTYMKYSGCDWTMQHNCPNQPAAAETEGPAIDDGTIGYECCCKRTMWKSSNWKDSDDKGGEPEEQAGSGGFDCDAGLGNWQSGWSPEKKEWCCKSEGIACENEDEELFDCNAGLENWERGWSEKKKGYCCKEKKLGCPKGEVLPEEEKDDEEACKTTDGDECVFPFTYDGVSYKDCTSKDHHSAWCATRVDKDGNYIDERWGLCGSGCEGCKTTDGATCTFPFTYDGKTYSSCTKQDHHRAWCATLTDDSGNYMDGEWGHCSRECEACETMSGDKCVFPFTYKGTEYQYCTKMDHHSAWCATETDLKGNYVDGKWGHCSGECEIQAGSECATDDENKECVFPFVYQGTHYIGCTKRDHNKAWCATETDREGNYVESAWGHCSEECQDRKACRATDDNECAFLFVYQGETFVSCTLKDHHSAWCATSTTSSGAVEDWGHCNEACEVCQTRDNAVCIFPFEYKDVTYASCTDKDHHSAWCATDTDADGKFVVGQWGHCNPECQVCHTFNGAECVFPFTYDGREYQTCTDKDHHSAWCATLTDKMGGVKSWGHCRPQCEQEYDCSGSESKASWSRSKMAWCCDREDVGCEAMKKGVKVQAKSELETDTSTTTASTTSTTAEKNRPKAKPKATSAGESKASDEDSIWTRREHPYFAAVKESCTQDLKKYCSTKSFKDRSFLRAVNCLAEHGSLLDKKCADAAFSGTLENPHPKLFKIVNEGEEQDCNITVHNDDGTTSITPSTWRFVSGYVLAPLMYTTPSSTPIFRTWFSMVPALTQPAPKGIIFMHTGGPLPAMSQVAGAAFGKWFGKHTVYIRNNYDVVSVDQRGMGMSSLELLYGVSPDTFSDYTWEEFATVIQGVSQNKGELFSAVNIVVSDDKGNIAGESPCKPEETDYANMLDETGFFAPFDFADEEQVDDWFTKKASVTKYCSDKFDKDDGEGKKYSPLQYVGTGALTYDMEYMRLAFGGPKISLLGFSYGTRVAAAYASAFPYNTARMGVTGVMAPVPDLLEYAQKAADNTAEILGWIVSQCAQEETCSNNPWNRSESSEFFEGGIDEAVNELFKRSMDGGSWYTEHCGKNATPLTLKGLTQQFQGFVTTSHDPAQGMLTRYQNSTWPWGFAGLPAMVYRLLNEPCFASSKLGFANLIQSLISSWSDISIFYLIPALDMTGRFDKIQAVKFLTTFASNPVFAPGLNMFVLYASASYGWPQLPMPIGFSNQNVPAVIANGLYDERTGMAYAQDFKLHFPNSSLVTSLSGGHCVSYDQGAQAWELLVKFLINGTLPLDGTVTGEYIPIDFEMGRTVLLQAWKMIPPDVVV